MVSNGISERRNAIGAKRIALQKQVHERHIVTQASRQLDGWNLVGIRMYNTRVNGKW
jgi:hypothetical protein